MVRADHRRKIARLSESEGVFTTAQAQRFGISRDALHDAVESGHLERVMRGAYRMVGSGANDHDELAAIWKLTAPSLLYPERRGENWDGIVVGGSSASALLEIGDLHLSPYQLYTPRRINSRNPRARFTVRSIDRRDTTIAHGIPVTRPERTIVDLVLDNEDFSLVADVMRDAWLKSRSFDLDRVKAHFLQAFPKQKALDLFTLILDDAGLNEEGTHSWHTRTLKQ